MLNKHCLEVYKRASSVLEDIASKRMYTKYTLSWDEIGAGFLTPQEKFRIIYEINKKYRYFLEVNNEGPQYLTVQITDMGKTIEDIKYELVYKIVKNIFNIVKYRKDNERIELEWSDIIDIPVSDDIIDIVVKGMRKYGIEVVYSSHDSIHFINNSEITKNQLMETGEVSDPNTNYVIPKPNTSLVLESKEDKEKPKEEEPEVKLRPDGVAETIVKITR